jgi:hypothetical protein
MTSFIHLAPVFSGTIVKAMFVPRISCAVVRFVGTLPIGAMSAGGSTYVACGAGAKCEGKTFDRCELVGFSLRGVSPTTIWRQVQVLRAESFAFRGKPYQFQSSRWPKSNSFSVPQLSTYGSSFSTIGFNQARMAERSAD